MSEGGWFRRLVNRSRPAALGLRRRILLIFTLGSLVLSVFLATTSYGLTRSNVVNERVDTAISTSQRNAQGVERDLRSLPVDAEAARASLTRIGVQDYLIWYADTWSGGGATFQDIDVPPPHGPMDFSAWFEAFLDGHWYTFDPRNNTPRVGRVLIARGRDASDVAISTTFGPATLSGFRVWTDEVPAGRGDHST